jgi:hypothetical protein
MEFQRNKSLVPVAVSDTGIIRLKYATTVRSVLNVARAIVMKRST